MFSLGQCERCDEPAIVVSEDGDQLCEDCIFEEACEELFGNPFDGDEL